MSKTKKSYYITTPIYYVNSKPHLGHAYTNIACDVIARFKRLQGYDVYFLTGTDEHGEKIANTAKKNNIPTQEFVDSLVPAFKKLLDKTNCTYSDFIRTTESRHEEFVSQIWKKMVSNGDIYLGKYDGWYSVRDEAFFTEKELIDGKAPTGAEVKWVEEPSYFFRLSKWQAKLVKFHKKNPNFILPTTRRNEVISFLSNELRDLSISRTSIDWGIKVPGDPKHVMYVWIDALFNYISALKKPKDIFEEYWPCDLHIMGKEIVRFHAIYWPAFLMSLDIPLPKRLFVHGFC